MLKKYYPSAYCQSVFEINYQKLYQLGFKGLIFDIDNTLVHHGDGATKEIEELFTTIQKMGFKTFLLTNNEQSRVEDFIQNIDTPYICDADKPSPQNYLKAVHQLGLQKEEVICIGDQVFTDILGANRSQMKSILVHFIQLPTEKRIGKKRYLEKFILATYRLLQAQDPQLKGIQMKEGR